MTHTIVPFLLRQALMKEEQERRRRDEALYLKQRYRDRVKMIENERSQHVVAERQQEKPKEQVRGLTVHTTR